MESKANRGAWARLIGPLTCCVLVGMSTLAYGKDSTKELERSSFSHGDPFELREAPIPSEDEDPIATQVVGVIAASKEMGEKCGKNPYDQPFGNACHPRHETYVQLGKLQRESLARAGLSLNVDDFERLRLTALLEVARLGMSKITAMSLTTNMKEMRVSWMQVIQHYSTAPDDPRTMQVYVEADGLNHFTLEDMARSVNFVDAYRRGRRELARSCPPSSVEKKGSATSASSAGGHELTAASGDQAIAMSGGDL